MNFGLNFGSIGIVKTLCLTCMNVFMMYVGKLVGMCKLCFMIMEKLCGYVHGYIYGYWQIFWVLWKNFVGYVRIYLCMKLWEFFFGHVEIFFLRGYGKIWWLYGYVINLVVVTFWWGIDLILWWGIVLIL